MAKQRSTFSCNNCKNITSKWLGCCPNCQEWNCIAEVTASVALPVSKKAFKTTDMINLRDVTTQAKKRMLSGIKEWDRVTGGGIMPGAFVILTGDPGIGKSTLLLQVAHTLAQNYQVLYFSSEESLEQVKLRAQRIQCADTHILFSDHANLDEIIATTQQQSPDLVIIDSIQNCYATDAESLPGSTGQVKESAFRLMRLAKESSIAILLSGHITKDGMMAGPKTLEHMVDAVFYLQGEDRWQTRMLRAVKNRFGTVNELGFFEMHEYGLQEMPNINQQLLDEVSHTPGSVLVSYIEGTRPLLIELQALTIPTKFNMPQRVVSGVDQTQIILIAAILEKYLQIKLSSQDIFFRVSGGFKIKGSSGDLGIALALLSSYFQQPLPEKSIALGELSLTGQIKPINHIGIHLGEAEKFGIERLMTAKNQKIDHTTCKVKRFYNVYELLSLFTP
jgi:DNA repair protein RadA/Sms